MNAITGGVDTVDYTESTEEEDRGKLHGYADEMNGYQLRLTVSFVEELFDLGVAV